jgi:hypothetical protein
MRSSLFHHFSVDLFREAFFALKRDAAPGVDGLTWGTYAIPCTCTAASRPAAPALAQGVQISANHACETGEPTLLAGLGAPLSLILSSMIEGTGCRSHAHPHCSPASNRHRARCTAGALPSATSCIVGLPTPADGACGCGRDGRHPQTFTSLAGLAMVNTLQMCPR